MAGDIEVNPGPGQQPFAASNFFNFSIRGIQQQASASLSGSSTRGEAKRLEAENRARDFETQLQACRTREAAVQRTLRDLTRNIERLQSQEEQHVREISLLKAKVRSKKNKQRNRRVRSHRKMRSNLSSSQLKPCGKRKRRETYKRRLFETFDSFHREVKKAKVELTLAGQDKPQHLTWPEENSPSHQRGERTPEEIKSVQRWLRIKDKFVISDAGYQEIRMMSPNTVPPLYRLVNERVEQNKMIQINTDTEVCNMSRRSVREVLTHLLRLPKHKSCGEEISVRFSGDGRQVTRNNRIGAVMGTVRIVPNRNTINANLDNAQLHHSIDEEASVFIYEGGEDYETQQKTAALVYHEIEDIRQNGIVIDGKLIKVKWYLTADWKYMATLLGLNQASSKAFCIWCHCTKKDICDFDIDSWNIQRKPGDDNKYAGKRDHKGHILPTLLHFPFEEIVPDVLHMVVVWAINQRRTEQLLSAMKDIGVPFRLMEGAGDDGQGSIKTWTQLNAKQLERVFAKLDLKAVLMDRWTPRGLTIASLSVAQLKIELRKHGLEETGRKPSLVRRLTDFLGSDQIPLPNDPEEEDENPILLVDNIIQLWKDFEVLAVAMKAKPGGDGHLSHEVFKQQALKWGKFFRQVTFDEHVTPYIHTMVYHLPHFLAKYRYLNDLSCESVEQKNHTQNKRFHHGSQRSGRGSTWTQQVMEYENRDLFGVLHDLDRKKAIKGPGAAQRRAALQGQGL
ncbi:hypothetical protein Bbelb_158660 [Branchiostoma belcheri]|nr:hypothetical protein Bbelb_158660 [Branchiostoma belcheri]